MAMTTVSNTWLAVLVAILVMASPGVESNPGAIWTSTYTATSGDNNPAGGFLFEENRPVLDGGGYSDTAEFGDTEYGRNAVDNFDNAGYSDTAQVAEFGITAAAPGMAQGFVRTRGTQFVVNGKPIFVNGANLYYLMSYAANPGQQWIVTNILRESAGVGVTVVRTWAFADGDGNWNLQTSPGVYSEQTFRGLDFVVAEAKKFGIRLILSLVNNYPDYGGRPQYVKWSQRNGNWNAQLDDFYTDGAMRQWYKNHIRVGAPHHHSLAPVSCILRSNHRPNLGAFNCAESGHESEYLHGSGVPRRPDGLLVGAHQRAALRVGS